MQKSKFSIRPFVKADLQAVQNIREAAFKPVFKSFRDILGQEAAAIIYVNAEAEQAVHLEHVCQTDSHRHVSVAEIGSRVAGFCSYATNSKTSVGQIGLNGVHPDYGGRGVGTALYEHALTQMKKSGMLAATVGTGGDDSHAPARRAYEKAGFDKSIPSLLMCQTL